MRPPLDTRPRFDRRDSETEDVGRAIIRSMCGIFGLVARPGTRVEPGVLDAMGAALAHRGPDALRVHIEGVAGIGAARLSIIDVEGGHQPVPNEDRTIWAVQNGELYNYRALRAGLVAHGHELANDGDTAMLPHLYEDHGEGYPERLDGMFATAVWDSPRGRLILARDRLGIKPLFWAQTADGLVFASEIKSILATGFRRELDRQALHDFLSLDYVPGPRTMFRGIHKLPAGHTLTWDAGAPVRSRKMETRRYWDFPRQDGGEQEPLPTSAPALRRVVRDHLEAAVEAAMVSDVPVGAFLSGGLDSSLVVALMSRLTDNPINTFSVGFGGEDASYDELPWARRVAEHCGTRHHETIAAPDTDSIIDDLTQAFDEPFADSSAVGAWIVAQAAAQHTKVVLSGDGGDEVFGGYVIYRADRLASMYRRLPRVIGDRLLPALAEMIPASDRKMSLDLMLRRFTAGASRDPLAAHVAWRQIFDEAAKASLYAESPEISDVDGVDRVDIAVPRTSRSPHVLRPTLDLFRAHHEAYPGRDRLNRFLVLDSRISLIDDMLTKVDRTSMAHSLEVRVPLLDHHLVELMTRIPSSHKVPRTTLRLKAILKDVAEDYLPKDVIHRKKAGFHVPVPRWLRHELRPLVEHQLGREVVARQGIFDPDVVEALVAAHMAGRVNASRRIWGLLMFGVWYERWME